jgi:hypothetical protein
MYDTVKEKACFRIPEPICRNCDAIHIPAAFKMCLSDLEPCTNNPHYINMGSIDDIDYFDGGGEVAMVTVET